MKKLIILGLFINILFSSFSQTATKVIPQNARPKLVVGIVIDQMRWDYLYYYYDSFGNNGFKKLMRDGF